MTIWVSDAQVLGQKISPLSQAVAHSLFVMPNADLASMEKQPKNWPDDIELAKKEMELQMADAYSG